MFKTGVLRKWTKRHRKQLEGPPTVYIWYNFSIVKKDCSGVLQFFFNKKNPWIHRYFKKELINIERMIELGVSPSCNYWYNKVFWQRSSVFNHQVKGGECAFTVEKQVTQHCNQAITVQSVTKRFQLVMSASSLNGWEVYLYRILAKSFKFESNYEEIVTQFR